MKLRLISSNGAAVALEPETETKSRWERKRVYFARVASSNAYKLGISVDPTAASNRVGLSLAYVVPVPFDASLRSAIVYHLTRYRMHTDRKDWYDLTPDEIVAVLGQFAEQGFAALYRMRPSRSQLLNGAAKEVKS